QTLGGAVLALAGQGHRVYRTRQEVTIAALLWRTERVIEHEREVIRDQLRRNGVDVIVGTASFLDPHTLEIRASETSRRLVADRYVIAVGTTPARPAEVEFDDRAILDSDGMLRLREIPRTLTIVGGGVIGLEYAAMAAALGVHVTLVEKRSRILDFVDDEIVEALQYHLRGLGVIFRLGEAVEAVERSDGAVVTRLRSGKLIPSEVVLYTAGREGATESLNLPAARPRAEEGGGNALRPRLPTSQAHHLGRR